MEAFEYTSPRISLYQIRVRPARLHSDWGWHVIANLAFSGLIRFVGGKRSNLMPFDCSSQDINQVRHDGICAICFCTEWPTHKNSTESNALVQYMAHTKTANVEEQKKRVARQVLAAFPIERESVTLQKGARSPSFSRSVHLCLDYSIYRLETVSSLPIVHSSSREKQEGPRHSSRVRRQALLLLLLLFWGPSFFSRQRVAIAERAESAIRHSAFLKK